MQHICMHMWLFHYNNFAAKSYYSPACWVFDHMPVARLNTTEFQNDKTGNLHLTLTILLNCMCVRCHINTLAMYRDQLLHACLLRDSGCYMAIYKSCMTRLSAEELQKLICNTFRIRQLKIKFSTVIIPHLWYFYTEMYDSFRLFHSQSDYNVILVQISLSLMQHSYVNVMSGYQRWEIND